MSLPFGAPLERPLRQRLDRLGAAGIALPIGEVARQLLALDGAPAVPLARRLLASALGCRADRLPESLDVRELPRLVEGAAAALPLSRAEFVVVDLETTGLAPARCRIVEIGAVRVRGGRLRDTFQTLIDPRVPIPPHITALTGIDRQMLDGAPDLAAALGRFQRWVGPDPHAAFVAHNARFDHGFLSRAWRVHGLPPWPGPVFCTRMLARRILPGLGRYGLDALSAHFGISNRWRHRALGDAEATARALVELLAIGTPDRPLTDVGDLLQLQNSPTKRQRKRRA